MNGLPKNKAAQALAALSKGKRRTVSPERREALRARLEELRKRRWNKATRHKQQLALRLRKGAAPGTQDTKTPDKPQ